MSKILDIVNPLTESKILDIVSAMNQRNAPDLIGVAEAAEILGVARKTVYRWLNSGRLTPVSRLPGESGAYLFTRRSIEAMRARAA